MTARPLFKVDRNVDWQARCRLLEAQLADTRAELNQQRRAAEEAVRNANRFHALLVAERIRKIPGRNP